MKWHKIIRSGYSRMTAMFVVGMVLGACGGGGGGTASSAPGTFDTASVSDNVVTTAALSTTSIDTGSVSGQTEKGSIELQWTAPSTRADGTPLSLADISGYRIYYGASAGNYPYSAEVADGTETSATLTDIPVGTYYLAMTTYDVAGRESGYSSAIRKTAL